MMEWLAAKHKDILHVADTQNKGNATARFGRFMEWKAAEKSSLGYPRVIMPYLLNGVMGYDYSGMHSDRKTVFIRIYDIVNIDTSVHGLDGGEAAIEKCEAIMQEFKRKIIYWKDETNDCGGWADVLQRMDLETMPYRELGPDELGDNCFGVEWMITLINAVDIVVDDSKWV